MDFKEVSGLRASARSFTPLAVSLSHLFTSQQNHNSKGHLLFKGKIDGLQRSEFFESLG